MEFPVVSILLLACFVYLNTNNIVLSVHAVESPQYTVIHSDSDFQIRLYKESWWVSAFVRGTSFLNSTKAGFHRLYQYMHGANLNASQFAVTAPVLTSVSPLADGSAYFVRMYLPVNRSPPQPKSELNIQIDTWRSHCVAVRNFTGFAKDDNVNKEAEALADSLNKYFSGNTTAPQDKTSYTIAQYNASRHLTGRLNEVWMNVSRFSGEGCPT
ncbi:hypothetical protein Patl1_16075 [Pistacia atlantica]|uniref:Uncharacterized protein n=1 Tax=Pistacia atlantica TaxID=434234 RepID=A0ACC1B922_9ROSI|nr:hypothetical protein Patl1_16075 [Pistacia atlantica]